MNKKEIKSKIEKMIQVENPSFEKLITKVIFQCLQDIQTALLELAKENKKIQKLIKENV